MSGAIGSLLPTFVKPIKFDKTGINKQNLNDIASGDSIIHLAAIVGEDSCTNDPDLARDINVFASKKLAEQIVSIPNVHLTYVSTGHVYGPAKTSRKESDPTNPQTLYAELKLQGELEVQNILSQSNNRLTLARVFSIMDIGLAYNSLPSKVIRILNGQEPTRKIFFSDDIRDFQSRIEIIDALIKVSVSQYDGILNVCSGKPVTVRNACLDLSHKFGVSEAANNLDFVAGVSALPYLVGNRTKYESIYK